MGWRSGSKLMIAVALGGCGAPSGSIAPLPKEEIARAAPAAEAAPAEPEPAAAARERALEAVLDDEAPASASQIDFERCRRFRVWPSWCNEAPKVRVRVRR